MILCLRVILGVVFVSQKEGKLRSPNKAFLNFPSLSLSVVLLGAAILSSESPGVGVKIESNNLRIQRISESKMCLQALIGIALKHKRR